MAQKSNVLPMHVDEDDGVDARIQALDAEELSHQFGYRNRRGVTRAIREGTFPIPTFVGHTGQRFAHIEHVTKYFSKMKELAEAEWKETTGVDWDC